MKLGEIEVYDLVRALAIERSAWIKVAEDEGRRHTDSEKVTINVLAALEHAISKATGVTYLDRPNRY